MEPIRDDPTIIATTELPRIGIVDEPRLLYMHEEEGTVYFTLDIDPTDFEDVVGPEAYQNYLRYVDARRGTNYADPTTEAPRRNIGDMVKSWLGKLPLKQSRSDDEFQGNHVRTAGIDIWSPSQELPKDELFTRAREYEQDRRKLAREI